MDQKNSMPAGNVEVPMDLLFQMIGEKEVALRVQGQRLQAAGAELKMVHDRLGEIAKMGPPVVADVAEEVNE